LLLSLRAYPCSTIEHAADQERCVLQDQRSLTVHSPALGSAAELRKTLQSSRRSWATPIAADPFIAPVFVQRPFGRRPSCLVCPFFVESRTLSHVWQ
jgi:hypothetical protein